MELNKESVSAYRELLTNPKEHNLPFPSFRELFLHSDQAIAKHVVYEQYQKLIDKKIPKVIFYILLDEIFPQKKDASGCLGYCLKFRDKIQIEKQKEEFAMGFGNWLWSHRNELWLWCESPVGMIRKPMIELLEIYRKEKEL